MSRLIHTERRGAIVDKYWLHVGDDNKDRITVESIQDVEPVIQRVGQLPCGNKDFQYVGSVPAVLLDQIAKEVAAHWGVRPRRAFRELIRNRTDRAKKVWTMLMQGRDYRRLQRRYYGD